MTAITNTNPQKYGFPPQLISYYDKLKFHLYEGEESHFMFVFGFVSCVWKAISVSDCYNWTTFEVMHYKEQTQHWVSEEGSKQNSHSIVQW